MPLSRETFKGYQWIVVEGARFMVQAISGRFEFIKPILIECDVLVVYL